MPTPCWLALQAIRLVARATVNGIPFRLVAVCQAPYSDTRMNRWTKNGVLNRINTDMLRSTFGGEASNYPSAATWAETAVPWLLGLRPADNGRSLTVGERH
jgi:hypothetical protein